jgi:hypothetical protein
MNFHVRVRVKKSMRVRNLNVFNFLLILHLGIYGIYLLRKTLIFFFNGTIIRPHFF